MTAVTQVTDATLSPVPTYARVRARIHMRNIRRSGYIRYTRYTPVSVVG